MRDLTRPNALRPAYKMLSEEGFEIFTPMVWKIRQRHSRRERVLVPVVHDLLFVNSERELLDPVVNRTGTLQYRYVRGGKYCEAMTVGTPEMERFIHASASTSDPKYFAPGEITAGMVVRRVEISGGPLCGYKGNLLSVKGMRKKRLIVELPGMISSAVEVSQDYIRFI